MTKYSPSVEAALDQLRDMARGGFDLTWMDVNPEGWGHVATPGRLGLGLVDVETGHYGAVPERGSSRGSMAPRGCYVPDDTPALDLYTLNEMSEVWSENAAALYDEAVVRQWNSVTDVPWDKLEKLPDDIEKAVCQMCTGLTEIEFVAGDMPAQWLCRINHDFHEVKLFLATQIMDEARHLDVFRKRALANGGGLLSTSPGQEKLLAATSSSEWCGCRSSGALFRCGLVRLAGLSATRRTRGRVPRAHPLWVARRDAGENHVLGVV